VCQLLIVTVVECVKYACYIAGMVPFQYACYVAGMVSFKYACYIAGMVPFKYACYVAGMVSFKYACNVAGMVSFKYACYVAGMVSFEIMLAHMITQMLIVVVQIAVLLCVALLMFKVRIASMLHFTMFATMNSVYPCLNAPGDFILFCQFLLGKNNFWGVKGGGVY